MTGPSVRLSSRLASGAISPFVLVLAALCALAGALTALSPLVGAVLLVALAGLLLVRMPRFTVPAFVVTSVFADYLSSWFPPVAGFPSGAIIRDFFAICVVVAAFLVLVEDTHSNSSQTDDSLAWKALRYSQISLAMLVIWAALLLFVAPYFLVAALSLRNIVLYIVAAFASLILIRHRQVSLVSVRATILTVFAIAVALGALDAMTNGSVLQLLHYNPSYAGIQGVIGVAGGTAAVLGQQRISGGVSDSLVYGYLMASVALYAAHRMALSRGRTSGSHLIGYSMLLATAVLTCALTLTRGAVVGLAAGTLVFIVFRRSRTVVLSVVVVVALAGGLLVLTGVSGLLVTRLLSQDPLSQMSAQLRLNELSLGARLLAQQPLGLGLGTEGGAALRITSQGGLVADNYLWIVGLQLGLPGLAAFALLVGTWAATALRSARRDAAIIPALITVYCVACVLSGTPDSPVYSVPFWMILVSEGHQIPPAAERALRSDREKTWQVWKLFRGRSGAFSATE